MVSHRFCLHAFLATSSIVGVSLAVNNSEARPWYEELAVNTFPHLFARDLDGNNLQSQIDGSSSDYVLVDFYLPWCPHCQHFAPEFERLALAAKRSNEHAPAGSRILTATVDCVRFDSACDAWGIEGFPTVLFGKRQAWAKKSLSSLQEVDIPTASSEAVAEWLRNHANIDLNVAAVSRQDLVNAAKSEGGLVVHSPPPGAVTQSSLTRPSVPAGRVDRWDIQMAAALLLHGAMTKADSAKKKQVLLDLVGVLARDFPEDSGNSSACRASLSALQHRLQTQKHAASPPSFSMPRGPGGVSIGSPSVSSSFVRVDAVAVEQDWRLCGTEWSSYPQQGWRSCKGTLAGKRGFTCGLWGLFHAIAARAEDDAKAQEDMKVMRSAVSEFFECSECRKHFEGIPVTPKDTASKVAVQLWWWRTHNDVNNRVKSFEDKFQDGDPDFPKVQWPTAVECPKCHRSEKGPSFLSTRKAIPAMSSSPDETWSLNEVAAFLSRFYGEL